MSYRRRSFQKLKKIKGHVTTVKPFELDRMVTWGVLTKEDVEAILPVLKGDAKE